MCRQCQQRGQGRPSRTTTQLQAAAIASGWANASSSCFYSFSLPILPAELYPRRGLRKISVPAADVSVQRTDFHSAKSLPLFSKSCLHCNTLLLFLQWLTHRICAPKAELTKRKKRRNLYADGSKVQIDPFSPESREIRSLHRSRNPNFLPKNMCATETHCTSFFLVFAYLPILFQSKSPVQNGPTTSSALTPGSKSCIHFPHGLDRSPLPDCIQSNASPK